MFSWLDQGLKFSGTVPDLRHAAFGCGKKQIIFESMSFEFAYQWYERSTAFTLNQTNITSKSELFALINTRCA